jgi:hypothetical protein
MKIFFVAPLVSLIQSAYPRKKAFLLNLLKNNPKRKPTIREGKFTDGSDADYTKDSMA